jgi:hypothetical protein
VVGGCVVFLFGFLQQGAFSFVSFLFCGKKKKRKYKEQITTFFFLKKRKLAKKIQDQVNASTALRKNA